MTNQPGRSQPTEYYFDENSVDALPKAEMKKAKDQTIEVPVEILNSPEAKSASEIAKGRRESVAIFFKNTKESFKTKASSVGNGLKSFFGKTKAWGNKAIDIAIAPGAHLAEGAAAVSNFAERKADQIDAFVEGRVEMAQIIAEFLKDKSIEKFNEVRDTATARYEKLKQYGADAVEAGAASIRGVRENMRQRKIAKQIAALKSVEDRHRAKADSVAATISLLQGLTA